VSTCAISAFAHTQRIEAPPEVVFPPICPVREGQWLDGWADGFELIYSASGFAEKNCVFRTYGHGDPEMTWTVSEHDQAGAWWNSSASRRAWQHAPCR
jgi:hypothetical protein